MKRGPFTTRQLRVLFVVVAIASVASVGLATHFTNDATVQNRLTLGATSGVEATITGNYHVDLSGDWATSNSVTIQTSEGNMTVTSVGSSSLVAAASDIEGVWTVVSDINGSPSITIDPDDKAPVILTTAPGEDTIDQFNFTGSMAPDDGQPDFHYSEADGTVHATIEGSFTDGTQYGAVDASNSVALDVDVANANNQLTYSGLPTSSHTVTVQKMGNLTIREETAPHDIITGCNATVRFYETVDTNPVIVERTDGDGDGVISLTGLPVDEEFVASIKCANYNNRTVLLPDLSQQKTAFLLHKNRTTVENRFTVEDNTGDFPPADAQIIIQKAINRSHYGGTPANFSWTNVAGDDIGADEAYVVDLEEEDRYRIVVQNGAGETRILGAYVPETTGTIPMKIGQVSITGESQAGAAYGATLRERDSGRDVQVAYFDSQDVTSQLRIRVKNETSGTVFYDSTTNDPSQRHIETVPLTGQGDNSFIVIINATRSGQADLDDSQRVGDVGDLFANLDIDPQILSLIGWVLWLAFTLFFALRSPVLAPAGSVVLAAGLVAVGVFFIPTELLGIAGAVGMLVLVAGRGR